MGRRWLISSAAVVLVLAAAPLVRAAAGDVVLVSRTDGNGTASGNAASNLNNHPLGDIAPDGSTIAFLSRATNLTAEATGGITQAFVRSPATGSTALVSRATGAAGVAANAAVSDVSMSDDGNLVVFDTRATNLTTPAEAGGGAVDRAFVRDRAAGTTALIAGATDGASRPAISGDGRFVAFRTTANLTSDTTGAGSKIYVRDLQGAGGYELVSRDSGSSGPALSGADTPSLSRDGRFVAFVAGAQVYVRDRTTKSTILVSRRSGEAGEPAATGSVEPDISSDGRYVVFRTHATNLSDDDVDAADDIFERDTVAATTTLVSRADGAAGAGGAGGSSVPTVSGDGRRVLFLSSADNLSSHDNDNGTNVYVRDTVAGTTTLVSAGPGQDPAPQGLPTGAAISDDGRFAAFDTSATLLPGEESGTVADVFRRELGSPPAPPAPPHVSVGDASVPESGAGKVTAETFPVTLGAASAQPVVVGWSTADGTATAGSDYRSGSGEVTFEPGQTAATISVDVLGDDVRESDETYAVTLSNPRGATISRGTATGTIRNDDVAAPPAGGGGGGGGPAPAPAQPSGLAPTTGAPAADCAGTVIEGLARLQGCFGGGTTRSATGKVTMNGLLIAPDSPGTSTSVSDTAVTTSGPVTVSAGDVVIHRGVLKVDLKAAEHRPAAVLTPASGARLYGLALEPRMALALAKDGVSELSGHVDPTYGRVAGSPLTLTGTANMRDGLRRDSLVASAPLAPVGLASLVNLKLAFVPAADEWRADVLLRLPGDWIKAITIGARFARATGVATIAGKFANKVVTGGTADQLDVRLGVDPLRLLGDIRLSTVGGKLATAGTFSLDLASTGAMHVDGTVTVGGIPLARAKYDRLATGAVSFLGAMRAGLPLGATTPRVGLDFALAGWSDGSRAFGAEGRGLLALDTLQISSNAVTSSTGMAACGTIGFFTGGFGYTFATKALTVMGPFVCDVGAWRAVASAAQAGGVRALRLGSGNTVLRLTGRDAPPVAVLRGPRGRIVSVPAAGAPALATHDAVVIRDPGARTTYVALRDARGTWTVEPTAGSTITGIDGAAIDPAPKVKAKVTGHGARRVLRWSVSGTRPGQSVAFTELGASTVHELGTGKGRRGVLRFAPGAGPAGSRRIVATLQQNGLPRTRKAVTRYPAPASPRLGRPGKLKLRARAARLDVRFGRAAGAAAYLVQATLPGPTHLFAQATARRHRATLTDVLPIRRATVKVTPVSADGRRGPARTGRLR